jgi:hypothetical protein
MLDTLDESEGLTPRLVKHSLCVSHMQGQALAARAASTHP